MLVRMIRRAEVNEVLSIFAHIGEKYQRKKLVFLLLFFAKWQDYAEKSRIFKHDFLPKRIGMAFWFLFCDVYFLAEKGFLLW